MNTWGGVLALLNTPAADGRFLLRPQRSLLDELPRALQLPGPVYDVQVGVVTGVATVGNKLMGTGDIDLRLLDLMNSPMAKTLRVGDAVGIMLDVHTASMAAEYSGPPETATGPRAVWDWRVAGAHLTDQPSWPVAQIKVDL